LSDSESDPTSGANAADDGRRLGDAPSQLPTLPDGTTPPYVVIITGLSGSGKTTAIRALEDCGFFCIDNLPVPLLPKVLDLAADRANEQSLAFVIDTRGREFLNDAVGMIDRLRKSDAHVQVLFLEADDEELVRRFSETRRRHPMTHGDTIREGIDRERSELADLREVADAVLDTSDQTPHTLGSLIEERYAGEQPTHFSVTLLTFGFKHGLPAECDLVFDLRFLPNPYYVAGLKEKDGRDPDVQDYVLNQPEAARFISHFQEMTDFMLPLYEREGKNYLTIGLGCTGGHHRSVSMAEELAGRLQTAGWDVKTRHRDVSK
jgi:UPF0042 nucleotide-binding protein